MASAEEIKTALLIASRSGLLIPPKYCLGAIDLIESQAAEIDRLNAQLSESQRRENEAIKDMFHVAGVTLRKCGICEYAPICDDSPRNKCSFKWHGLR